MDKFTRHMLAKINYYNSICIHEDLSQEVRLSYQNMIEEFLDILIVYRDPVADPDEIESDMMDNLKIVKAG